MGVHVEFTESERNAVLKRTAQVQKQMFAKNTTAVYGTGVLKLVLFAMWFRFPFSPPTEQTLAAFVVFQSKTCCHASLKVYLYAIRAWVLSRGHPWKPWTEQYQVYGAMQGLKRLFGHQVVPKLAVTPALLLQFVAFLQISEFNDLMMLGAMLVAFFGLFRKDNITVGKPEAFNPRANLTVGDFEVDHAQGIVWVRVKHSKVIQFRERFHWIPLVRMAGHPLCPFSIVCALLEMHRRIGSSPDSPMFLWKVGKKVSPMTHAVFVKAFKRLVKMSGLDWTKYSGHSFRRGGATYCFNLGVCPELIKLLGDWKSDAYLLYDQTTDRRRLELPRAMMQAIQSGVLHHGARRMDE